MTLINFSRKVIGSSKTETHELVGKDARGRDAYYFIKIPLSKGAAFRQALKSGGFSLKDFGVVIASGFGAEIPEALRTAVANGVIDEPVSEHVA